MLTVNSPLLNHMLNVHSLFCRSSVSSSHPFSFFRPSSSSSCMPCIIAVSTAVVRGQGELTYPEVIRGETVWIFRRRGQSGQALQHPRLLARTLKQLVISFHEIRKHFWASANFLIGKFKLLSDVLGIVL